MKQKNIFILVLVAVAVAIVYYTLTPGGSDAEYIRQVEKERKDKDNFMKSSSESPFAGQSEGFKGLSYFPPDLQWRVIATWVPIDQKKTRLLQTNDGRQQRYLEYAYAEFDLGNRRHRLLVLEGLEMGLVRGELFLAFGDATSANETYGGGRYLDVKKVPGSATVMLDFNKAYNPYCAYNGKYSCPLPPEGNLLEAPIRAGEKNYIK